MVQNNQKEKIKAAKQKEKIKAAKKSNTFSTRECSSDAVKPDGSDTSVKSKISKTQKRHLSEGAIVTLLILSFKKKKKS